MYKTNRVNHNFQIAYFLAGACHTPDGAYAQLCDLREDRERALQSVKSSKLRTRAKRARAEQIIASASFHDTPEVLDAQADIAELDANIAVFERNYAAAQDELAFIERCIERIQPLRKYSHMSDADAHQAAQAEEWKLELIRRAENCMLTMGTISTDHYATMRLHPEFKTAILPAINEIRALMQKPDGAAALLERTGARSIEIQKQLGLENEIPQS